MTITQGWEGHVDMRKVGTHLIRLVQVRRSCQIQELQLGVLQVQINLVSSFIELCN